MSETNQAQTQNGAKGFVQSIIAVGAVILAFMSPYTGTPLPEWLQGATLLIVGFYFGRKF